jgi:phosphoglycolate phosphatase
MANLIFDFDGTIADSFALNVDIFCKITGRPLVHTQADINRLRQMQTRDVLRELNVSLWKIPFLLAKWRKAMTQRIGEVKPFPAIGPVLRKLQQEGHELSIVSTNSQRNIELFLTKHDLRQFFTDVYGDIGFFGKHRTLKRLLRQKQLTADACFYIGDETRDVKAGKKVGMRTIAVAWGYTGEKPLRASHPRTIVQAPKDLLAACAK